MTGSDHHSWGSAPSREAAKPVPVGEAVAEGAAHSAEEVAWVLVGEALVGLARHRAASAPVDAG